MAAEEEEETTMVIEPTFPSGRIKRLMKLDKDINKINAEALFMVSCSLDLFIESLANRCAQVALEKKRKTVKLEHLRIAVQRHQPTSDFLLDSLPQPPPVVVKNNKPSSSTAHTHQLPPATRRIDHFFQKSA